MKIFIALILIIVVVLCIIVGNKRMTSNMSQNKNDFYSTEIKGKLMSVYSKNHGVGFTLESGDSYVFFPRKDAVLNDFIGFDEIVAKGDSVYKEKKSDTLAVWVKGKKYTYISISF